MINLSDLCLYRFFFLQGQKKIVVLLPPDRKTWSWWINFFFLHNWLKSGTFSHFFWHLIFYILK